MSLAIPGIELGVVLASFTVLVILGLPKVQMKRDDVFPLLTIAVVSLIPLLIDLPKHVTGSEFEYMSIAENLGKGKGNTYCQAYLLDSCINPVPYPRKPGFPVLVAPLIALGVDTAQASISVSLFFNILSSLLFYLALERYIGKPKSLTAALALTFMVPKIRLYLTAASEAASMFFMTLSVYFLSRFYNSKKGEYFAASCAAMSYFVHIRPENFLTILPLAALLIHHSTRDRANGIWTAFLIFNIFFAGHGILSNPQIEGWDLNLEKRITLFSEQSTTNILFFFDWKCINPFISLLFLLGIWKGVKQKNPLLLSLLLSFTITFVVYSAFEFSGRMLINETGFDGFRRALLLIIPLSFLGSFALPEKWEFQTLIVASSIFFLFFSPAIKMHTPFSSMVAELEMDSLQLENESKTIYFEPPIILHSVLPKKSVKSHNSLLISDGYGSFIFIENPFYLQIYNISESSCNHSLLKELQIYNSRTLLKKHLVVCG